MAAFDVAVLGLGAMGSAATYHLARRGARVLGLDQHQPPHGLGSTHGESRVTRLAVGEGGHYHGLVRRSHELWREIEAETGSDLLTQCGLLIVGPATGGALLHGVAGFLDETVRVARTNGIDHEILDERGLAGRYPELRLRGEHRAFFEPSGGFVRPERCVTAQLGLAARHGAVLRLGERVEHWTPSGAGVVIEGPAGQDTADTLIVTTGPWAPELLGEAAVPLTVTRQVNYWFRPVDGHADRFTPERFPVFIWQHGTGPGDFFYGIPALGPDGVKVGTEDVGATATPATVDRAVSADERERMAALHLRPHIPALDGVCTKASVCLYTETPDRGFIIDRHPASPQVLFASACSGHGFKHSAAIGEALAQLAMGQPATADLSPFALGRFRHPG